MVSRWTRWTTPATRRNLIPNYTPIYNDLRLSRCASCQRVFTNRDDLRHHILLTHTGKKPHACAICGKRYGLIHHLNSHYKLHREPRLQEFSIFKQHHKPAPKQSSPPNTTIGSFKVSKGFKPCMPEQTFKSFGTLQSFTITQLDKHKRKCVKQGNGNECITSGVVDHDNSVNRQDEGNESRNDNTAITISTTHENITLPDISVRSMPDVMDHGTQTSRKQARSKRTTHLKDFWVDTKSEWQSHTHNNRQLENNDTTESFKGYSDSVYSQPVSFQASTPKEPRFFDDPGSTSTIMSGVKHSSDFDPLNRRTKRKGTRALGQMLDSLTSVNRSIYE